MVTRTRAPSCQPTCAAADDAPACPIRGLTGLVVVFAKAACGCAYRPVRGVRGYHLGVRGDAAVRELADQVWERVLDRDPVAALRCRGGQVDALPRGGPAAMEHDVSAAAAALARLTGLDGVEAAFLRDHLAQEVAERCSGSGTGSR